MNFSLPGRFVEPSVVVSHFHLCEGYSVADFGAGSGFYLKALSEAVGSSGRVYACEIQKQLVEKLGDFARLNGLGNVSTLWCDLEEEGGIKLPDRTLDVGLLINTLFLFEQKETALKEIKRVIRHEGLLNVIDWSESFGGMGPRPGDVVEKADAIKLLESVGFILESEFPAGDHHYGLTVRKI